MHKESFEKVKGDIEFYRERAEQAGKSYERAQEQIRELEKRLEKQVELETRLADSQVSYHVFGHIYPRRVWFGAGFGFFTFWEANQAAIRLQS